MLVYGHVLETLDDYVGRPPSSSPGTDGSNADTSGVSPSAIPGITPGANLDSNPGGSGDRPSSGTGNSGIPEGSLTFSPRPAPTGSGNSDNGGWGDAGTISGNYAGGGGTAFMSSNWMGKESVGSDASSPFLDSSKSSGVLKEKHLKVWSLSVALACLFAQK